MTTAATMQSVLYQDERWLRTVLESIGDAIVVTDTIGRVEFMNRTAERLTRVSAAEAFGRPVGSVLQLRARYEGDLLADLAGMAVLNGSSVTLGTDLVLQPKGGEPVDVEGEIAPFEFNGALRGTIVTFRDVTAHHRDELANCRNQKLRAVAQLAGSIAHDLNNALTVILGYSDELLVRLPDSDPLHKAAEQIRNSGDVAAKVSEQLRLLSRKELLLPKVLSLNEVIEHFLYNLQQLAGFGIEVHAALAPDLSKVRADPDQIVEMLRNFVLHAHHILPRGGRIELETEDTEVVAAEGTAPRRRYARLRVSYSGSGLRREQVEDMFQPPFGEAESKGLELFIIQGIVGDASGHINVSSQSDMAPAFEVFLPAIDAAPPVLANESPQTDSPTILLVEDDPGIRSLVSGYLERSGYQVLDAENGEDAVVLSDSHEGLIDLLITDIVMPVMSGTHLVQEIAGKRPETKVLLMSGCPPEPTAVRDLLQQGVRFLQKPFRSEELLLRVKEVLAEGRPRVN